MLDTTRLHEPTTVSVNPSVSLLMGGVKAIKPVGAASLKTVWLLITTGAYKSHTLRLRRLPKAAQKPYKLSAFHGVTVAGIFNSRGQQGLRTRSGWLVLDFDDLTAGQIAALRRELRKDKVLHSSIVLAFISPSKTGLKVWVKVDTRFEHKQCYQAVVTHIEAHHAEWAKYLDKSGSDLARMCLLCHDPNAYLNPNHESAPAFPMPAESLADLFDDRYNPHLFSEGKEADPATVERWVEVAEQVPDFAAEYHTWFRLGMAFTTLGETGRSFFHRVSRTSIKYDERENNACFDHWLKVNQGHISIGTFLHLCKQAGIVPEGVEQISDEIFTGTPCFAASTFQLLPNPLQEICQHFPLERERDIALMGLLGTLSGCFPTLQGHYRRKTFRANQYVFVTGKSGTGKGALEVGRELLWPYHEALRDAHKKFDLAQKAYERQLRAYEQAVLVGKQPAVPPIAPVAPAMKQLFGGADNSVANVVKTMAENDENLILFDTEADSMTNSFKQDIGDYSPLLRKSSEHEPYLYERKTAGTYELGHPALSVVLSGTPQQVRPLIQSVENGLFSRFWFYAYSLPHTFDDPFAEEESELEGCLQRSAKQMGAMIDWVANYSVSVRLTPSQQERFRSIWTAWLAEGIAGFGESSGSAMKRQARACFRLCMLLTLLRNYEVGEPLAEVLICGDDDFTAALEIADVLRQHALIVYQQLAPQLRQANLPVGNQKKAQEDKRIEELFLQGLGSRRIGKQLNMAHMTVVGRIKKLGLLR